MLQFKNLPAIRFQNLPDNDLPWKAYNYCKDFKDRPDIRKLITSSGSAYNYCRFVKDRPEIRKLITSSGNAYLYCIYVKDRPEIRKLITNLFWKQKYLNWKKKNVTV